MTKIKDKWGSLDKEAQKWASRLGAIATIAGILVGAGTWLAHQIDNSLAARLESHTAQLQTEVSSLDEKISSHNIESERRLMRLELMILIDTDPTNILGIERLAREYFSPPINGDQYMTAYFSEWAKDYDGDMSIVLH